MEGGLAFSLFLPQGGSIGDVAGVSVGWLGVNRIHSF
jgi:hypothetical protein